MHETVKAPKPSGLEKLEAKYQKKKAQYTASASKKTEGSDKKEKQSVYKKAVSDWRGTKPTNPNKKAKVSPGLKAPGKNAGANMARRQVIDAGGTKKEGKLAAKAYRKDMRVSRKESKKHGPITIQG